MRPRRGCALECGFAAMDFSRSAYRSERTYRDVRFAGADYYYAVFQAAGRSVLTQNDEVAQLAVGDIALLDTAFTAAMLVSWSMATFAKPKMASEMGASARSVTISPFEIMAAREGVHLPGGHCTHS